MSIYNYTHHYSHRATVLNFVAKYPPQLLVRAPKPRGSLDYAGIRTSTCKVCGAIVNVLRDLTNNDMRIMGGYIAAKNLFYSEVANTR